MTLIDKYECYPPRDDTRLTPLIERLSEKLQP